MSLGQSAVIQVTNLSAIVTSEQMRTLFSFLGDIEEVRLYPPDNAPLAFSSKVCYVKYRDPSSVGVAQHLTNTVFIDRALIVVPCAEGKIPEEAKALSLLAPAPLLSSLLPGAGLLPIPAPTPTPPLASSLASVLRREKVEVPLLSVPLTSLGVSLPAPLEPVLPTLAPVLPVLSPAVAPVSEPPLMGNVDPTKVDEIRRTVYVGNLNSQTTTAEQLLEFFKQVGDVRFVRMAGDETQPTRFAFVEFADQSYVTRALTFNGVMFGDRPLKINHSNNAIVKPPEMTPQAAAKELEEVMKRVREAQSFISAAIEPETGKPSEKIKQEHSKTRSRSRSKSRSRRKRSHSKHRSRSHNRSHSRHKEKRRSKSPNKKRSRSKDRRRSRSRSRSRKKQIEYKGKIREKERQKDKYDKRRKEKRSRSPSKSSSSVRRSRSTSRERHKRRSRSLSKLPRSSKTLKKSSRSPSPRSKSKKEKKRGKERDHSGDRHKSERSVSQKHSKDQETKEAADQYDTKLTEKDHIKDERNNRKEVVSDQEQGNSQHNGDCQVTEESPPQTEEMASSSS
ncbi:splicing regulatory glutamine/lysine-rich protein 1 isoform X2 [Xenopus laevis]|uniref:Splicing regulatory glutamine/lysine-rich protein 1 n=1 Tax=Xenopus laevis TaxID=8355 RepID=A0A8J1M5Y8_XENLA|nr:splicing regulatory glutamine/lysine-rich protein 1 isoform X2 [Xenopus laevis]